VFGPQDILRPPHARSRPFCYPSLPAHAQITRDYLVYILSSLELGCAGVRQGLRAIHPSIWGPKKHLQMRRTHEVGSRWICIFAPARLATFFGMGMDMSERPLHRRLGLLLRLGGPAPVRTCKLQSSVMAELRNGEGETLRVGTSDRHPQKAQTLYTQRRPFLHTLHDRLKAGARFEDQSKNGATGPEIRVRWGEYHAGNAGESRLAVRCLLDDALPTCAKTRNRQLHHQSGLISGN